ncbi:urease accessory protein UreE [Roseovarius atlanticus]|uniref:Urease accessory protein UreE n=1 Tax=Roseovarius atlanticus TaxID=1641875 RepID=A0A0T5NZ03_9RHOB|nr:urease accessory protein UreE [Roseovarius atlanticus]KRS14060.1 urease accessory protein UreE [Roseovarius atlanticus]
MTKLPVAQKIKPAGTWRGVAARCPLTYEDRFFRRRKLTVEEGWSIIADFEQTVSLNDGDALETMEGLLVRIVAAPEALLAVTGPDLARLAWHIGNRHTPCQIEAERLLIRDDPVIAHMLAHLGATTIKVTEAFRPEGGAYGHGRTHSHEHGASAHHAH